LAIKQTAKETFDIALVCTIGSAIFYAMFTWMFWSRFLETKIIQIEGVNEDFNTTYMRYYTISKILDTTAKNPVVLKTEIDNLVPETCYRATIVGVSSFYQDRHIKTAIRVECPK
jgi:hypothetical protein